MAQDYRRTLQSLANLELSQRKKPPPIPSTSSRNLPPPPPPYYSRNSINAGSNSDQKPKLPYNVKLPKVNGPSEAERKLELLTRDIEKEFDEKEKQEHFGKIFYEIRPF